MVSHYDLFHFEMMVEALIKRLLYSGTADFGFNTPMVAAITLCAMRIDCEMPPFAADSVMAMMDHTIDADTAPAPRAHNDAEYNSESPYSTLSAFRQDETIGVVHHADRPIELFFNVCFQRFAVQAGCIGIADQASDGIQASGNPNTDG
jgi:hypothetical protein